MNTKVVGQLLEKVTNLEKMLSQIPQKQETVLSSGPTEVITPFEGNEHSSAMVLAGNNHQVLAIDGHFEQVIQKRESAAYSQGFTAGIAIMGLIGATLLMKMLR